MAGLAIYLRHHDVNPVREENMGRQTPDSFPRNLLALLTEGPDLLHFLTIGLSPGVTAKTQHRGRTASRKTLLHSLMAACALEPEFQVLFMGELNRLPDCRFRHEIL
jgi:hypothetical protein